MEGPQVLSRLWSLLEEVSKDLQQLNKNLKSSSSSICSRADIWCWWKEVEASPGFPGVKGRCSNCRFKVSYSTVLLIIYDSQHRENHLGGFALALFKSREPSAQHECLAEIIEMIHTVSLIHDDVIDESGTQRGKETIHELYGTRAAVLAEEFMFARSSWFPANFESIEVIRLKSQVIRDFASGEIKQDLNLFNCDLTLEDYLLESYCLIAANTKAAVIFSGESGSICEQMYEYGKNLGLSFQVVDILDFTQSAEQLGKPACNGLAKGNLSAPVIFALEEEPELRDIIDSEFSEDGSLSNAMQLVNKCGGIKRAQELTKAKGDRAIQNLLCLL